MILVADMYFNVDMNEELQYIDYNAFSGPLSSRGSGGDQWAIR